MAVEKAHKLIVVGLGPGGRGYVLPVARAELRKAKVLAGGRRALRDWAKNRAERIELAEPLGVALAQIRDKLRQNDVVVMVSGDPGFYSMLARLKEEFPGTELKVLPGLSSLQLAFARLAMPWQDAELVSLHGRDLPDAALRWHPRRRVGFLTDPKNTPSAIAQRLCAEGWPSATACFVLADLSYPTEKISQLSLGEMRGFAQGGNCVVVVG